MWPWIHKTKERRQIDPIECGAVALAIVLEYFGVVRESKELRTACGTSRDGSNAASIIEAAKKYSLQATAQKVLVSELDERFYPSILFFDNAHFVVYEGFLLGKYYINDPALGRYSLNKQEFRKRFRSIAIRFTKTASFTKDKIKKPLYAYVTPWPAKLALLSLGFFLSLAVLLFSSMVGLWFSELGTTQPLSLNWLGFYSSIFMMLLIVGIFARYYIVKNLSLYNYEIENHLSLSRLKHIHYSFFEYFPFSLLQKAFISSNKRSYDYAKYQVNNYIFTVFMMVTTILIFFVAPVVLSLLLGLLALTVVVRHWRSQILHSGDIIAQKTLEMAPLRLNMGQAGLLSKSLLEQDIKDLATTQQRNTVFFALLLALVLFAHVLFIDHAWHGTVSLQETIALLFICCGFMAVLWPLSQPFKRKDLDEAVGFMRELSSSFPKLTILAPKNNIMIALDDVEIGYAGQPPLLSHVSFSLPKHGLIGLVGAPSVGKTSLLHVIGGKMLSQAGTITHFTSQKNGLLMAMVDDDADVMAGSLKDVVSLFDKRISEHEVVNALQDAQALELFHNRPHGLLSPIYNHGANMSAGEKKRLMLAQALVRRPDLLVLDNFFIPLHHAVIVDILAMLRKKNITTIFTSFDPILLSQTDEVIFINNHQLIIDKHDALYGSNDEYRKLL